MKQKHLFFFILFISIILPSSVLVSCSEEDSPQLEEKMDVTSLYSQYSTVQTYSVINMHGITGRADTRGLPIFSEEDILYLQSLSQEEFEAFRNELLSSLSEEFQEVSDSIAEENYSRTCDVLGGMAQMERLEEFSQQYIDSKGGEEYLMEYLPKGLNSSQEKIYVAMAVYIDKVARPVYLGMLSEQEPLSRSTKGRCETYAGIRLALAGVDFGVEQLCDIMTGGIGFTVEGLQDATLAMDLTSIWLEYERCNGRWH